MLPSFSDIPIIDRLGDRFKLTDAPNIRRPVRLSNFIQPITNVDDLIRAGTIENLTFNVTAVGEVVVMTVPALTRRHPKALYLALASGTFTMSDLNIYNGTPGVTLVHQASFTYIVISSEKLNGQVWEPGWTLSVYVDSKAVNGTGYFKALFEDEYAYAI